MALGCGSVHGLALEHTAARRSSGADGAGDAEVVDVRVTMSAS